MIDYKLTPMSIVDELAQFIREVDGNNRMGAGALAEKICERFRVDVPAVQAAPDVAALVEALETCLEMEERPKIIKMARAAIATYRKQGGA